MQVQYVRDAKTAHPTGDPNFAVKQSMPSAVPEAESDPFLMCDEFGPTLSKGAHGDDSDTGFDVGWHPHHGMDILSYMVEGKGRHADSLGNRETFDSPGFQVRENARSCEREGGGGGMNQGGKEGGMEYQRERENSREGHLQCWQQKHLPNIRTD